MSPGVTAIIVFAIIGASIAEVGKAFAKRGGSPAALAALQRQLAEQAEALEAARAGLVEQAGQIEELNERLDFAERVLAQARERPLLQPAARLDATHLERGP